MITLQVRGRPQAWWGLLAALIALFAGTSVRAALLVEDGGDDALSEGAPVARWEALAVSSSRSSIGGQGHALTVDLASGDHAAFSRTADLTPAPTAVLCRFNFNLSALGTARPTAQVFRMGWDFGGSNADEAAARTYGELGLSASAEKGFQLRDRVSGVSTAAFRGTQAITWALNNSGRPLSYAAPNGTTEALANDRMDVWVGREKVFDDILTTSPAGRITDLKWYWSQGSGVARFDHFEIRTLDEVATATGESTSAANAATLEAGPAPQDPAIALDRPTPNPFTSTMRFAYGIPSGSAGVDIGIFDLAGRRVRSLARGSQVAGQYEVRWDGLGDDGLRVKHGVYFLRASVGTANRVSRVVYLSQ
jgi:hypothetical protein